MDYKKVLQYCKGETLEKATLGLITGIVEEFNHSDIYSYYLNMRGYDETITAEFNSKLATMYLEISRVIIAFQGMYEQKK